MAIWQNAIWLNAFWKIQQFDKNDLLTKQPLAFEKGTIRQNDILTYWQNDIMTKWHIDKNDLFTKQPFDKLHLKMVQLDRMTYWYIARMTYWQNDILTKWHNDKMTKWQNDKMTKQLVDEMTSHQIWCHNPSNFVSKNRMDFTLKAINLKGKNRETLLKGMAQYSRPPCANLYTLDASDISKNIYFFTKQATLMWRSIVLILPLQLVLFGKKTKNWPMSKWAQRHSAERQSA